MLMWSAGPGRLAPGNPGASVSRRPNVGFGPGRMTPGRGRNRRPVRRAGAWPIG